MFMAIELTVYVHGNLPPFKLMEILPLVQTYCLWEWEFISVYVNGNSDGCLELTVYIYGNFYH